MTADMPPSTYRIWPLTKSEAGEARNSSAPTSSSGLPPARRGRAPLQQRVELRVGDERAGELGVEVARADRVDLHARRAPVGAHPARQHLQAALAGGVGRGPGPRDLRLQRGDVDDLAAAALDHPAGGGAADQEGAGEVRLDDAVPLGLGELEQRRAVLDAGVVDEDVERAELRLHRRDAGLGRLAVGDVERHVVHAAAGLLGGARPAPRRPARAWRDRARAARPSSPPPPAPARARGRSRGSSP